MLKSRFSKMLKVEAGCDEAGRGCLAGPVYAAAVILPPNFRSRTLNDSKQMLPEDRYRMRDVIMNKAIAWSVGIADHREIDEINILNASFLAMHRAIAGLKLKPELLLIDGNRFRKYGENEAYIPHHCIVKGDGLFLSIAAASVLAKTFRDDFMKAQHIEHPQYGWDTNKGYATAEHRAAIKDHGQSPIHRKSFHLKEPELELAFES